MSIKATIRRFFKRNFGADREYVKLIDDIVGVIPYNIDLYKLALINKSASIILEDGTSINNERLEYLGDAIINAVTSDFLYIEYPSLREGALTQLRAKIISRQSLNSIARQIGLDKYVVCKTSGNYIQKHIFGDALEALIGAIYLDHGYDYVNRLLINDIFANYLDPDDIVNKESDYKSRLIEWSQREHLKIEFRTEVSHDSTSTTHGFYSKVLISGVEVGYGTGSSKKEAEQAAAYSVSHGTISDKESDAILEKVDMLELEKSGNSSCQGDKEGE